MGNNNKIIWVWLIVGALVIAGLWWWYAYYQPPVNAPQEQPQAVQQETAEPLSGGDTIEDITRDLNAVDLGNIDQDFQQLDADIDQL